jgi:hypothetical protein
MEGAEEIVGANDAFDRIMAVTFFTDNGIGGSAIPPTMGRTAIC